MRHLTPFHLWESENLGLPQIDYSSHNFLPYSYSGLIHLIFSDGNGNGGHGFLDWGSLKKLQDGLNQVAVKWQIWSVILLKRDLSETDVVGYPEFEFIKTVEKISPKDKWYLYTKLPIDLFGDMECPECLGIVKHEKEPHSPTKFEVGEEGLKEIPKFVFHDGSNPDLLIDPLIKDGARGEYPGGIKWLEPQTANSQSEEPSFNIPVIPNRIFFFFLHEGDGAFEMTVEELINFYMMGVRDFTPESMEEVLGEIDEKRKKLILNNLMLAGCSEEDLDLVTRALYRI